LTLIFEESIFAQVTGRRGNRSDGEEGQVTSGRFSLLVSSVLFSCQLDRFCLFDVPITILWLKPTKSFIAFFHLLLLAVDLSFAQDAPLEIQKGAERCDLQSQLFFFCCSFISASA
jgi:hypothetical protein